MKRVFLYVVFLLMLSISVFAQTSSIPPMMNFQGRLAKPDGTPVSDGNYQITFSIFAVSTGGTALWTQTMNPVLVRNGVFAVLLGNGNPLTADMLNGTPYLEIKVGNDPPLAPRQQFASVAFAFKANTVPDGAITTAKIADGAITAAKFALGVGGVPSGYSILGDMPTPPSGYVYNGETISGGGDSWATQTAMPQPRYGFISATVNGLIYVIGGNNIGNSSTWVNTNYVYDPVAGMWTTKASLPVALGWAASAVVNGKIHLLGGRDNNGTILSTHEIYDPVANTWTTGAALPVALSQSGAVVYNSQIFMIGGWNGSARVATNYVYDDTTDTWTTKSAMPTARYSPGAVIFGQNIYIIGGLDDKIGSLVAYANNEVYNIATDTWTTKAPLPTARGAAIAVGVFGKVDVIGGWNGPSVFATNEEYDPILDTWRTRTAMPTARRDLGYGLVNNSIYALGGYNGGTFATNEVYTPAKTYYLFTKQ